MKRRDFIKTCGATGLSLLIPSSILGNQEITIPYINPLDCFSKRTISDTDKNLSWIPERYQNNMDLADLINSGRIRSIGEKIEIKSSDNPKLSEYIYVLFYKQKNIIEEKQDCIDLLYASAQTTISKHKSIIAPIDLYMQARIEFKTKNIGLFNKNNDIIAINLDTSKNTCYKVCIRNTQFVGYYILDNKSIIIGQYS
jgi:hypothetical protein